MRQKKGNCYISIIEEEDALRLIVCEWEKVVKEAWKHSSVWTQGGGGNRACGL